MAGRGHRLGADALLRDRVGRPARSRGCRVPKPRSPEAPTGRTRYPAYRSQSVNPRCVVLHVESEPATLYGRRDCARDPAANRNREAQLDRSVTRSKGRKFAADPLRPLLAALAYGLIERLHATAPSGTALVHATASTIRVRPLENGAANLPSTRPQRVLLVSRHPMRAARESAARAGAIKNAPCCPRLAQARIQSGHSPPPLPTRTNTTAQRCTATRRRRCAHRLRFIAWVDNFAPTRSWTRRTSRLLAYLMTSSSSLRAALTLKPP